MIIYLLSFMILFGFVKGEISAFLPVHCVINATGPLGLKAFDLTSLTNEIFYKIEDTSLLSTAYLSLCRNLNDLPIPSNLCGNTSVCIVQDKTKEFVSNAGNDKLTGVWDGSKLEVTLSTDKPCSSGITYKTVLNLLCSQQELRPTWKKYDTNKCQLEIDWVTPAACPVSDYTLTKNCLLKHNSYTYDLKMLRHSLYYNVSTGEKNRYFELNICGTIHNGQCSTNSGTTTACEVVTNNSSTVLKKSVIGTSNNSELSVVDGNIVLTYFNTQQESRTIITFICSDVDKTTPRFVYDKSKKKKTSYHFDVETPAVCKPGRANCLAKKNGKVYDLSQVKLTKSWKIRDTGDDNVYYQLNVCGSVQCGRGDACLINGTRTYSLGVALAPPVVNNVDSLTLEYKHGDWCENGLYRRGTKIDLHCSDREESPQFVGVGDDCVYKFVWSLPAACSVEYASGTSCTVKDPTFGHIYDLSSNYHPSTTTTDNNTIFNINLCSVVNNTCAGKNTSVCLVNNGTEIAIGYRSTQLLKYISGRLSFELTGDECLPGYPSSVHIVVLCDGDNTTLTAVPHFISQSSKCAFNLVWQTKLACPTELQVNCKTRDNSGNTYDLSPLASSSINYHVPDETTNNPDTWFVLNVCRSLIHGHDSQCAYLAGSCMYNKTSRTYHNLGYTQVDGGLKYVNNQLELVYSQGEMCLELGGLLHAETSIKFVCDPDNVDGYPVFVSKKSCKYEFVWSTRLACSDQQFKRQSENDVVLEAPPAADCTFVHSNTKFRFNLNPLAGREYQTISSDGTTIKLSVCSGVTKGCSDDAGFCYNQTSGGQWNNRLLMTNDTLTLKYVNGSVCNDKQTKSTSIQFICQLDETKQNVVEVVHMSDCLYQVQFHTKYACENMVNCFASNNTNTIDLSVLRRMDSNYKMNMSGADFYFNICRQIIPVSGVSCNQSSACVASSTPANGSNIINLGVSYMAPVLTTNNTVLIKNHMGSTCRSDNNYNYSSLFKLTCEPTAGIGVPVFSMITHDCEYQYQWNTSVVCPDHQLDFTHRTDNCTLYNKQLDYTFDLRNYTKPGGVLVNSTNKSYMVNLCNTVPPDVCDSLVCEDQRGMWSSYGQVKQVYYSYNRNTATIYLSGGALCDPLNSYSAHIELICSMNEDSSQGVWSVVETDCHVVLEWRTPAVCVNNNHQQQPVPSSSSSDYHSIKVTVVVILIVVIVLAISMYLRVPGNRLRLLARFNNFINKRRSSRGDVQYLRVGTTEEATFLLRGPGETESEDDDELLRL